MDARTLAIDCLDHLRSRFLSILPRIATHARICFRHVRCPHKKADFAAEVIALAWKWFLRLAELGKDATGFPATLATYAVKAVRSGRRVCGLHKAGDIMNERIQQRRKFTVGNLPEISTLAPNPLMEALHDNTKTPPPDAAAFRCDWPAWLTTRTDRDRHIIHEMVMGERTKYLARKFGVCPARISQLRREYQTDWNRYTSDRPRRRQTMTASVLSTSPPC